MTPRIILRPDSPSSSARMDRSIGPRCPDGRPFLFEVLGAPGARERGPNSTVWSGAEEAGKVCATGLTSLENNPPPALDPRMWTEADGTEFSVRGPSYLSTRVKVPSANQVRVTSSADWTSTKSAMLSAGSRDHHVREGVTVLSPSALHSWWSKVVGWDRGTSLPNIS